VRGQGEPDTSDGILVGWAILRACELGVPKDEVRAAILFRTSELEKSSEPRTHIERWLLKQAGDKAGVLAAEDLAGVKPFATTNPGTSGNKE